LIGIDGADDSLFTQFAAPSRTLIPNMLDLMNRGLKVAMSPSLVFDELVTSPEPPRAWTMIATGFHSLDHRIESPTVSLPRSYDEVPITALHRGRPAIWNILSAYGLKVCVVGWWTTWPAEWVHGSLVSDRFFTQSFDCGPHARAGRPDLGPVAPRYRDPVEHLTYPDALAGELEPRLRAALPRAPELLLELKGELARAADADLKTSLAMLASALERDFLVKEAVVDLLKREPDTRFTACYFDAFDVACHRFWKCAAPDPWLSNPQVAHELPLDHQRFAQVIERVAAVLDRFVGEIRAAAGESAVLMIVSEHGAASASDRAQRMRNYNLNRLLEKLGLLVRAPDGSIDWSRTRCFDRDTAHWNSARRLSLNFASDYPQGFLASGSSTERRDAWKNVLRTLSAVTTDHRWRDPGPSEGSARAKGEETTDLFWLNRPAPWEMIFVVWHRFPLDTRLFLRGSELGTIDALLPLADHSGRHRDRDGFLLISPVGRDGLCAPGRPAPLGQDVALPTQVAPTLLALFDLPRPIDVLKADPGLTSGSDAGEAAPEAFKQYVEIAWPPLLWIFEWDELRRLALLRVPSYRGFIGRRLPDTELGRRNGRLLDTYRKLGYFSEPSGNEVTSESP